MYSYQITRSIFPDHEVLFSRAAGETGLPARTRTSFPADHFACVALMLMEVRRGNFLDTFAWPSTEDRSRQENLPFIGPHLYSRQFIDKLVNEMPILKRFIQQ